MIFFTADTHFGQERTLIQSKRPFSSVTEMNEKMIEGWNKTISPNDKVYHLGDFGKFDFVKKLNGTVILVCGNYEISLLKSMDRDLNKFTAFLLSKGFSEVVIDELWLSGVMNEKKVHLSHSPEGIDKNCLNLFGHVHSSLASNASGINVGVDVRNFQPMSEVEIASLNIFTKQKNEEMSL